MLPRPVSTRNLGLISAALLPGLTMATIAVVPTVVRADDVGGFKGTLTVQFTATSQQCAGGDTNCSQCVQNSGFYVEAQGIADTSLGSLFAKVLKCAYPTPPYGTYTGTMTLSTTPPPNVGSPKDYLTLAYSGQNSDAGDFYGFQPFSGKLTVKNGVGKFQGASGTLTFIAQSGPSVAASEFGASPSPFSLTGNAFYSIQGTIER